MSLPNDDFADDQRRRWMRPNAHLWMRPDARRFRRPDAERFVQSEAKGWRHPHDRLWNPYFRYRKPQPDQARAAAAAVEWSAAQDGEPVRRSGPSTSEILKLKSDLAALRLQHAVIRHEIAIRRARGLLALTESDDSWRILLKGLARFQETCRKAGFDPNQPRDDRGRWTDGGGSARPEIPEKKPATARLRNRVVKEVAKWLAKAAAKELTGPIGTFLNVAEAAS